MPAQGLSFLAKIVGDGQLPALRVKRRRMDDKSTNQLADRLFALST